MICEKCASEIAPRTARQLQVLEFVRDYMRSNGYRPSYAQIARNLGLKSKATVAKHIKALNGQGISILAYPSANPYFTASAELKPCVVCGHSHGWQRCRVLVRRHEMGYDSVQQCLCRSRRLV